MEFLNLKENRDYQESELEQALINKLQEFLLELGKGFSFVARQRRITLDGDHFGIPFSFLPHEGEGGGGGTPRPKYAVHVNHDNARYEISWPNIIRIDHELNPRLHVDILKIEPLTLDASKTRISAEVAPFLDGKPDLTKCTQIDLEKIEKHLRMQEIIFQTAARLYEAMESSWKEKGSNPAQVLHFIGLRPFGKTVSLQPIHDAMRQWGGQFQRKAKTK